MTRARFLALVLPSRRTYLMPSPLQHQHSLTDVHAADLTKLVITSD